MTLGVQSAAADIVVGGGLHASATWQSYQLRSEIDRAREETQRLALSPEQRSSVEWVLAGAAAHATSARADEARVAALLARAIKLLEDAGVLATAGTGLIVALRRSASLLGAQGAAVLVLL